MCPRINSVNRGMPVNEVDEIQIIIKIHDLMLRFMMYLISISSKRFKSCRICIYSIFHNHQNKKYISFTWFELRERVSASRISKKYAQQLHCDSVQSVSEPELKLTPYTGNCCKESFEMKMCHLVNGHEYIRQGR